MGCVTFFGNVRKLGKDFFLSSPKPLFRTQQQQSLKTSSTGAEACAPTNALPAKTAPFWIRNLIQNRPRNGHTHTLSLSLLIAHTQL